MRKILFIISFAAILNASTYQFDEYRVVKAVNVKFKKSGVISFNSNEVSITYNKPNYQKVISSKDGVVIHKEDGEIEKLEGRALTYTKVYLNLLRELDDVGNYKNNKNFKTEQDKNIYTLYPKGDMNYRIEKIVVETKNKKVKSFTMYMGNEDIIEIVKR